LPTFSLETLLKLLKERLDLLKEDLAALYDRMRREREVLVDMEEALRTFMDEFSRKCNASPRAFDLLSFQQFFPQMEGKIEAQRKRISLTEGEIEQKKREIIALSLRLKTIERLKERELESLRTERRRQESKTLDEMGGRAKKSFPQS